MNLSLGELGQREIDTKNKLTTAMRSRPFYPLPTFLFGLRSKNKTIEKLGE
jgi:hypothetical protein